MLRYRSGLHTSRSAICGGFLGQGGTVPSLPLDLLRQMLDPNEPTEGQKR
jgi:hypothetical protein